jgi:hypothetical protein
VALGTEKYKVENFRARVDWAINNLNPDRALADRINTRAALWRLIKAHDERAGSLSSWKRALKDDFVPNIYLQLVCTFYPELTREALIEPKYRAFLQHAGPIQEARERWEKAAAYLAANRGPLAILGKRYHETEDDEREFPLIAKRGWLLRKPLLLSEHSRLPTYNPLVRAVEAERPQGLNIDYVSFKSRLMPRDRLPWNDDCYRLLGLTPKNRGLDIELGPSTYFECVNSLEAIAVELADFARRNTGGNALRPDSLPLRGTPNKIFDFPQRSAMASVSCILLLKNHFYGTYSDEKPRKTAKFVLHERGVDVFENQNVIGGVPGGGHAPLAEKFGDKADVSLWRTVVREFLEEFFDRKEFTRMRGEGAGFWDLIRNQEVKPYFDAFFDGNTTKIFLLGAGIDPVSTKPEFLIAIVADWAKASVRVDLSKRRNNFEGRAFFLNLTKDKLMEEAMRPRGSNKHLHPAAKACLLLAAKHFDFLMNRSGLRKPELVR